MRRIIAISTMLLMSGQAAAHGGSGPHALRRQIARHGRYFDAALSAVVAGKIPPHAKVRATGGIALVLGGLSAAKISGVEVRRGEEQRYEGKRIAVHLAGLFAVGPFRDEMIYFAADKAYQRAGALLPAGTTRSTTDGVVRAQRVSISRKGRLLGAGRSLQPGMRAFTGMEWSLPSFRRAAGGSQPSPMLTALRQGQRKAQQAGELLSRGDEAGAQAVLAQLVELRATVVAEKRELYSVYRRALAARELIEPTGKSKRSPFSIRLQNPFSDR